MDAAGDRNRKGCGLNRMRKSLDGDVYKRYMGWGACKNELVGLVIYLQCTEALEAGTTCIKIFRFYWQKTHLSLSKHHNCSRIYRTVLRMLSKFQSEHFAAWNLCLMVSAFLLMSFCFAWLQINAFLAASF